jgi:hypothetical protein
MDGRLDVDEEERGLYDMANGQDRKEVYRRRNITRRGETQ